MLRRLAEIKPPKFKRILAREIIQRLNSGCKSVKEFLLREGYDTEIAARESIEHYKENMRKARSQIGEVYPPNSFPNKNIPTSPRQLQRNSFLVTTNKSISNKISFEKLDIFFVFDKKFEIDNNDNVLDVYILEKDNYDGENDGETEKHNLEKNRKKLIDNMIFNLRRGIAIDQCVVLDDFSDIKSRKTQ